MIIADCTGKNAAIVNGIEYRLFFERVTAHSAQKKCKQWGIEWKSTEIRADLIKEIGQDLQTCLKQMIESNVSGWDYNSKKDVGYFIGGSITSSEPNGWRWNKGGAIPLPEEVSQQQTTLFTCKYFVLHVALLGKSFSSLGKYSTDCSCLHRQASYLENSTSGFNKLDNLYPEKLFIESRDANVCGKRVFALAC